MSWTYNRDSFTGLDYADQRFYASSYGRFNSPDPYRASGRLDQFAADERGSDCEDFAFSLTSSCGPYGNGSVGSIIPSEDESQEPQCDIQVQHLTRGFALGAGVHSYPNITQSDGTSYVLEGDSASPFGSGFLNPSKTGDGAIKGENPSKNTIDFDARKDTALTPQQICADIDKISAGHDKFPKKTIPYSLLGKIAPNSNSFLHYLLNFAPDLGNVKHSKRAYGWDHPIVLP
jgi:hypothetical protein